MNTIQKKFSKFFQSLPRKFLLLPQWIRSDTNFPNFAIILLLSSWVLAIISIFTNLSILFAISLIVFGCALILVVLQRVSQNKKEKVEVVESVPPTFTSLD